MLLKDAFHQENIEFGINKSFEKLKVRYGFEQIKNTEHGSCRENIFGLALRKNDLEIYPFIALFEYELFFVQKINGRKLKLKWLQLWWKFLKDRGVSQSDNVKRKSYWDKEIGDIIDYSKPVTKIEMENMIEKQFEFINRNFKEILEKGDISFLYTTEK